MENTPTWPFKVVGGLITLGLLWWFLPLLEYFQYFIMFVCIPLMVLVALGMVSAGTAEGVMSFFPKVIKDLQERVSEYETKMAQEGAE